MNFRKALILSVCLAFIGVGFADSASAQSRDRVVKQSSSQPTNQPPASAPTEKIKSTTSSRPVLTNEIKVVRKDAAYEPLVEKTASVAASGVAAMAAAGKTAYGMSTSTRLDRAIKSLYGIPYRYGATGPNRYDCSGFVWAAFQEAGIDFTRTSARVLWNQSEPVSGDDRFKFGTLVFLNGLGHMGIVADENGFYHASSSKGITYSPFKGYWSNRIVGFRRLVPETPIQEAK
ncbi:MAG: C40 family peptidase [Pyrinomonadaceae bacterium]